MEIIACVWYMLEFASCMQQDAITVNRRYFSGLVFGYVNVPWATQLWRLPKIA